MYLINSINTYTYIDILSIIYTLSIDIAMAVNYEDMDQHNNRTATYAEFIIDIIEHLNVKSRTRICILYDGYFI